MPIEIPGSNPSPSPSNGPKLQVDSDWKAQAQAEKDRLARLEAEREKERGAKGEGGPEGMPPADFKSLVGVLASQAISGLGMREPASLTIADITLNASALHSIARTPGERAEGRTGVSEGEDIRGGRMSHEARGPSSQLSALGGPRACRRRGSRP